MIHGFSGQQRTDAAADQYASYSPAQCSGIELKIIFDKRNGARYDGRIVTEQKSAKRSNQAYQQYEPVEFP